MNNMQAMINGMSQEWQRERSQTQMTLGQLIERFENMPLDRNIKSLGKLYSYRGYYSDLSFSTPESENNTVEDVLDRCKLAMGKIFYGYKGGEYLMGESTPLWVAEYGRTGLKLIAINDDGSIVTQDDD